MADFGAVIDKVPGVILSLTAGLIGGVFGASIKFVFDNVLTRHLGWRYKAREAVNEQRPFITRSAESLERRINILVRNADSLWFREDEYFRLSTLYLFADFLARLNAVERRLGYLPMGRSSRALSLQYRMNGIYRALSSRAYFRSTAVPEFIDGREVPRLVLAAIGELSSDEDGGSTISFTAFSERFVNDAQFAAWIRPLVSFLELARPDDAIRWDRLIACGAELRLLVSLLDPRAEYAPKRDLANLELLHDASVSEALRRQHRS